MKIYVADNQKNQTKFTGIYKLRNVKYNQVQDALVNSIKTAMRKPLEEFNGQTAEGFYKTKKGIDFMIRPNSADSVYLSGHKGLRKIGTGKDRAYASYSESIYIGEYDKNSEFKISDIKKKIIEKNNHDKSTALCFLMLPLAFAGIMIANCFGTKAQKETVKPLIENVSNAVNKTKAVLPDTTKILKAIKK